MKSYGPASWLDYYDTDAFMSAWHYTSRWILHITLHTIHHAAYKLESKQSDAFHCTLPSTLWSTLLIALDCTLPACFTIRSQLLSMAHAQPAWLYALKYALKTLSSILPSTLSNTLPAYLALCSQIHSPEARHSQSHLTICSHVCSCVLGPETCWVAGARHQEAWSWWRVAGGWWCGGWLAAYVVRNRDIGRYLSLNLILIVATTIKSHHASRSWCWQLQPLILQER